MELRQTPEPASFTLRRKGDVLTFALRLPEARPGRAWLRTNLGRAAVRRREIRDRVEKARPALARDWHDVRMVRVGAAEWALRLPLLEVGSLRRQGRGRSTREQAQEAQSCLPDALPDGFSLKSAPRSPRPFPNLALLTECRPMLEP